MSLPKNMTTERPMPEDTEEVIRLLKHYGLFKGGEILAPKDFETTVGDYGEQEAWTDGHGTIGLDRTWLLKLAETLSDNGVAAMLAEALPTMSEMASCTGDTRHHTNHQYRSRFGFYEKWVQWMRKMLDGVCAAAAEEYVACTQIISKVLETKEAKTPAKRDRMQRGWNPFNKGTVRRAVFGFLISRIGEWVADEDVLEFLTVGKENGLAVKDPARSLKDLREKVATPAFAGKYGYKIRKKRGMLKLVSVPNPIKPGKGARKEGEDDAGGSATDGE